MTVAETNRIDRSIDIEASPDRVWRALTDPGELSTWFKVIIEGELIEGGEVWMTSVHPEHHGVRFSVRIVEMRPPSRLVWAWHPGNVDSAVDYSKEPRTTVTFTL
ncbi:MAG TPA: SRPBCC domain-containing protein, partial [Vicinamibacterales bacterium]|nr:SRPBCC domain-containing protein [Vicinamibacterales bacterium]